MIQETGSSKRIKVGPWGGQGGASWDEGRYSGVRSITLTYGRCIDSIRAEYDKNGKSILGDRHGGNGGTRSIQVKFEYPEEYLTTVSGHVAPVVQGGSPVIRSLAFKSNKRSFGPFGAEEGTPFTFPMEGGMIVGFSGRSGRFLDAIGLYLSRIHCVNLYGTMHQRLHMGLCIRSST